MGGILIQSSVCVPDYPSNKVSSPKASKWTLTHYRELGPLFDGGLGVWNVVPFEVGVPYLVKRGPLTSPHA